MLDESLDAAEQKELLDTLFHVIRHDVRNRLAAARMAAHWLKKRALGAPDWSDDPRFAQFHALIDRELVAIDELLTRSLPRTSVEETVALARTDSVAARAVEGLELPLGVTLALAVGDDPLRVDVDAVAVALRALVRNAAEATVSGAVRVTSTVAKGRVTIEVEDDGPGLTDEMRAKSVAGLFTTKVGHRGLGVATAARIARSNEGELVLHEGTPTRVALTLPIAASEP